jgi:hypothetical protein
MPRRRVTRAGSGAAHDRHIPEVLGEGDLGQLVLEAGHRGRTAPAPLGSDDGAVDEQLAAPHAARLTPLEGALQAGTSAGQLRHMRFARAMSCGSRLKNTLASPPLPSLHRACVHHAAMFLGSWWPASSGTLSVDSIIRPVPWAAVAPSPRPMTPQAPATHRRDRSQGPSPSGDVSLVVMRVPWASKA